MIINHNSEKIRYTGRWNVGEKGARSTANGSYFEFGFSGECAVIGFDISYCRVPFPHVYISVDDGAKIEVTIDRFVRISADAGEHKVMVIMKSSVEDQHRWFSPIESGVSLLDIEADGFIDLSEDTRPVVEFIGDSITEGISIDVRYFNYGGNKDMIYWDDATAGYAWLTAKKLDFRPVIMGYGGLGTTRGGLGGVPCVGESYKYYSDGYLMESFGADYIVINHGTNDWGAEKEVFEEKYYKFLELVRKRNPLSKIIALTPFSGSRAKEIKMVTERFNTEKNDSVFYIDSTGWISPEPIHPTREGHKTVSEKLSEIIRKL